MTDDRPADPTDDELIRRLERLGPTLERASLDHAAATDLDVTAVGARAPHRARPHRVQPARPARRALAIAAALLLVAAAGVAIRSRLATDRAPATVTADPPAGPSLPALRADGSPGAQGRGPAGRPEEEWSVEVDCPITSCTIAADARGPVVAGLGAWDDGSPGILTIVAFEGKTGEERWRTSIDLGPDAEYEPLGGLVLDGERVLYHSYLASPDIGRTVAFDRSDGTELWTHQGGTPAYRVAGAWIFTTYPGALREVGEPARPQRTWAVDLDDGQDRWDAEGQAVGRCGDQVYLLGTEGLSARAVATGEEVWSERGPFPDATCNRLGAYASTDGGAVVAWDPSGTERWTTGPVTDGELEALVEGVVAKSPSSGAVVIDADGTVAWSIIGGSWQRPIQVGDDVVLAHTYPPTPTDPSVVDVLRAYDLRTGEELGSVRRAALATNTVLVPGNEALSGAGVERLQQRWTIEAPGSLAVAIGGGRAYLLVGGTVTAYG